MALADERGGKCSFANRKWSVNCIERSTKSPGQRFPGNFFFSGRVDYVFSRYFFVFSMASSGVSTIQRFEFVSFQRRIQVI